MTIHHATLKKAQVNGILLQEKGADKYLAHWPERNVRVTMADPKEALASMLAIKAATIEHGVKIIQDENGTFSLFKGKKAIAEGEDVHEVIAEGLEELFGDEDSAEAEEREVDEEEIEDEEPGSIVKPKYREEYKARGTPTHCNDWLAQEYTRFATSEKPAGTREVRNQKTGKVRTVKVKAKLSGDVAKHYAIARANGVDKTWPSLNPGQQCMNSRNMVRAVVIKEGVLHIPGMLTPTGKPLALTPDRDWLEEKRGE